MKLTPDEQAALDSLTASATSRDLTHAEVTELAEHLLYENRALKAAIDEHQKLHEQQDWMIGRLLASKTQPAPRPRPPHTTNQETPMPQNTPRRDTFGIVLASSFLLFAATIIVIAVCLDGWGLLLLLLAAPALLFGIAGLALDAVKRPRDSLGRVQR